MLREFIGNIVPLAVTCMQAAAKGHGPTLPQLCVPLLEITLKKPKTQPNKNKSNKNPSSFLPGE